MYYFIGFIVIIGGIIFASKRKTKGQKIWLSILSVFIGLILVGTGITKSNEKTEQLEQHIAQVKKNYNKRAKAKYKELADSGDYPLAIKQDVNFDSDGKVSNIQLWCDESLANADQATLRHYYSMGAQVASYAVNKKDGSFPIVQVYSGSHMVTRSDNSNHNQNVDVRK